MTPAPERPDLDTRWYDAPIMGEAKWTCLVCSVSVLPENWPNHLLGASHADHSRIARDRALAAATVTDAGLREAAQAVVDDWDGIVDGKVIGGHILALRAALSRQAEKETA